MITHYFTINVILRFAYFDILSKNLKASFSKGNSALAVGIEIENTIKLIYIINSQNFPCYMRLSSSLFFPIIVY